MSFVAEREIPFVVEHLSLKAAISAIVAVFCVLGVIYSVVTPIFEASDELWHYPVVQYIAAGHGLPVQTPPEQAGLWKQEASQPPLYYALAGLLTAWVDTSDLTAVLRPNPHAAIGVVTPDGNINMVAHDPAREAWPWRGTVLAVHLARLLSVALGTATVYLTYRLGREAFPGWPEIALGAAAFNAFTPMFVFISGSVNNDNLVIPLCALALLIMIGQVKEETGRRGDGETRGQGAEERGREARDLEKRLLLGWLALGVVIGLGTLAKVSALALLPLAALTGTRVAWQRRSWRHLFAAGLAIGLPVFALTGWWFWRNVRLYGDLLGFGLFTPYFTRTIPADLAQLWSERTSFLYGYWGNFGGLNLPIPGWTYTLLNTILLLAVAGLIKSLISNPRSLISNLQSPIPNFPLFLIASWALIVVLSWINWTRTTWSSQGRLVFSAIPSYSILIVAGVAALLPRRVAPYALGAIGVGMALLSMTIPFSVIAPAYARPPQFTGEQIADIPHRANVTFGDALVLLGYDAPATSAQPGDSLAITLYWQALGPLERDYSVFVHLLDENAIVVQNPDKGPAYPGRGMLPTTTLVPGQTWAETWVVPVRPTAYAPAHLAWEVGLYDASTGERLQATRKGGGSLGDNFRFGQLALARPPGSSLNPVSYNFGNQVELIGFDLDRRAASPGEAITLSLAWRAWDDMPARDYTVFVHVLEPPQSKWAGADRQPSPPTSSWKAGQVVTETYPLLLDPAAPPGVYEIEVGVYYFKADSAIERLKVLTRDGRQQQDFVLLSRVRVTR